MVFGIAFIICLSFLASYYMYLCHEAGKDMFDPMKYGERIKELEMKVKELEKKV